MLDILLFCDDNGDIVKTSSVVKYLLSFSQLASQKTKTVPNLTNL